MIGTDYELFITREDGTYMPVPPSLDLGSKNGNHIQLDGGTMHRDNVMVELCPDPEEKSASAMADRCLSLNSQAEQYLTEKLQQTVTLSCTPSVTFDPEVLKTKTAREIGCDRDYLAQNGDVISRTPLNAILLGNVRCGAGHVHMSYGSTDTVSPRISIPLCDVFIGCLEATFGKQGERRKFYGMRGLYRPKVYGEVTGVEYRTPSNLWLQSREHIEAITSNALALERILKQEPEAKLAECVSACYVPLAYDRVLENEDADSARNLLAVAQSLFPEYDIRVGV